jgi:CheY-like chemotaxis protein
VLTARDGYEALDVAHEYQGRIDVLLTDIEMPRLGGVELAERIRTERPETKIIFMSGRESGEFPPLTERAEFLQKPFLPRVLLDKIATALGGSQLPG